MRYSRSYARIQWDYSPGLAFWFLALHFCIAFVIDGISRGSSSCAVSGQWIIGQLEVT